MNLQGQIPAYKQGVIDFAPLREHGVKMGQNPLTLDLNTQMNQNISYEHL